MNEKLKIGILIQEETLPAWMFCMLSKIIDGSYGTIELILQIDLKPSSRKKNSRAFRVFENWDRNKFKQLPDAFELRDIKDLLHSDTIKTKSIRLMDTAHNKNIDFTYLKNFNLDILINLTSDNIDDGFLEIAKYGVWSYHYGDYKSIRGISPNFWEFIKKLPETGVSLLLRTREITESQIIFKATSLTDNLSLERGKNSYYWKAASLLPRKIDALFLQGEAQFFEGIKKINKHPDFYSHPLYAYPGNKEFVFHWSKFQWKRFINGMRGQLYFNQWILLFFLGDTEKIGTSFYKFKKIIPPRDRFWADPHVIYRDKKYYIFIEELIYSENKGFISVIEMDEKGNYKDPVKILEKPYHLSYPFVFENEEVFYMVPESKEANNIQLYKCVDFPYQWELEKVLMDNVQAVDTTILFENEKYWLFTNLIENKGASTFDELFLFYSDILITDSWKPHPNNPIVSDVKNARPAGKLFHIKDSLYRPAQNCSVHYGYGMQINEVIDLSETSYKEKTVDSILPLWEDKIISTHTICHQHKLTIIDAQIRRNKWM